MTGSMFSTRRRQAVRLGAAIAVARNRARCVVEMRDVAARFMVDDLVDRFRVECSEALDDVDDLLAQQVALSCGSVAS